MQFFQHVAGLCPRIKSLHISHPDREPSMAIAKVMELWTLSPFVTDWSFTGTDAPIIIASILTCAPNMLTSLEIKTPMTAPDWNPIGDPELPPNDPKYGSPDNVRKKDRPRKIWACRNLRKMDIIFGRKPRDPDSIENSRMIFSYLSKVCPDLEDLTVRLERET
ncbi:hypothetical protein BGZ82_010355 [Podila clonocystis]|nr:hypothetical protein BGZ82_010355 [Podila clonocystis]